MYGGMSALGQKPTFAAQKGMSALPLKSVFPQKVMSALPPKADICSALAHVCFGPKADIEHASLPAIRSTGRHGRVAKAGCSGQVPSQFSC
jgi:hypothetical protein